ncbi:CBS domain-containing protein [bacterium]|nr:MAG: CBS domain-containing protein [bacterium]
MPDRRVYMLVENAYQTNPPTILNTANLAIAADLFIETKSSDLMVVDQNGSFIGILSEGDLIRRCMPKYSELIADGLSLDDIFELFIEKGKMSSQENVMTIAITNPITVTTQTNLQKAASYMVSKNIRRLPVVEDGKLIGSVSRAMIAKAILNP